MKTQAQKYNSQIINLCLDQLAQAERLVFSVNNINNLSSPDNNDGYNNQDGVREFNNDLDNVSRLADNVIEDIHEIKDNLQTLLEENNHIEGVI